MSKRPRRKKKEELADHMVCTRLTRADKKALENLKRLTGDSFSKMLRDSLLANYPLTFTGVYDDED